MLKKICAIIVICLLFSGCKRNVSFPEEENVDQKNTQQGYVSIQRDNRDREHNLSSVPEKGEQAEASGLTPNMLEEIKNDGGNEKIELSKQINLILTVVDNCVQNMKPRYIPLYYCTVTDLNQNGRLEVVIASCIGSGLYTYFSMYEVQPNGDEAVILEDFDFHGEETFERAPDIILPELHGIFDDEESRYSYYVYDDLVEGAIIEHSDLIELSFGNPNRISSVICMESRLLKDDSIKTSYYDAEKNEINYAEYEEKLNDIEGKYNISYTINWLQLDKLSTDKEERARQLIELYDSQIFILK